MAALLVSLLAPGLAMARPARPPVDPAEVGALLAAAADRDTGALDRLAEGGPGPIRALAAVARVHTLEGPAARRAAIDAGFVVRWQLLEPIDGGPRGLAHVTPPLDDWIEARPGATYSGAFGVTTWRPAGPSARFGLLEPTALTAEVPGHRLARAAFRLADGGTVVAHVYSAGPWRLWVDGAPAGGGWGEPSLRTARPVVLQLGPGPHRLLMVGDGADVAFAVRFAAVDGAPLPVEPLDGRDRPHGVSLGPLPGRPAVIAAPLAAIEPTDLPPLLAPRSGIAEATPDERRALAGFAPRRADLWRRIARDDDGAAARARAAALDPLDLEARRAADPLAWPAPPRDPEPARTPPPPGFDGPLWWALADHRLEVGPGGALIEQHHLAVRVLAADGEPPWPPADADARACTVLRGRWVRPVACPDAEHPAPALARGDIVVVTWRRGRRWAATRIEPPPAPFGRWSVRVDALIDAPLRIELPPGADIGRAGDRRTWDLAVHRDGAGPVAVGTVVDDDGLFRVLDRRLPPVRPARVADARRRDAVIDGALARSAAIDDPLDAARALIAALAEHGEIGEPVFARAGDPDADGTLPDPDRWSIPLVALGDRVLDPRHREGARAGALQGARAVRIGADGRGRFVALPVDPPEAHRLSVTGELRVDDGAFLAVTLERRGHSPFADPAPLAAADAAEVIELTADRIVLRRQTPAPLFALPGWIDGPAPGPHEVVIELSVQAPAGARAPADVQIDGPSGRYDRVSVPTADGWSTRRHFVWRAAGEGAGAFLDAVRKAEAEPLVIGGPR